MKSKFSKVVDFIVTRAALFTAAFVWARYMIDDVWLSLMAAALLTLLVNGALRLLFRLASKGKTLKSQELRRAEEISRQFLWGAPEENAQFLSAAVAAGEACQIIPLGDCFVAEKEGRSTLVCAHFSTQPLTRQHIVEFVRCARRAAAGEAAVLYLTAEKNIDQFCASVPDVKIKLFDPVKTYALLKSYDVFPAVTQLPAPAKKTSLKTLFSAALSRARAKAYIAGGLFLFALSFFTLYRLYYLLSASALLLIGILSHFNKKYNVGLAKNMSIL